MKLPFYAFIVFLFYFNIAFCGESNQLQFETYVVPNCVNIPSEDTSSPLLIILKITNQGSQSVLINKYETPLPRLTSESGKENLAGVNQDGLLKPQSDQYIILASREVTYIFLECILKPEKVAGEERLIIKGKRNQGGEWMLADVLPGIYKLSLCYTVKQNSLPSSLQEKFYHMQPWFGSIVSNSTTVEFRK